MDGVDDLLLFAAVVSEGSFSAAGRKLGIPKSRVSRRIAELESRLGVRLLQRSTRAIQVTELGMTFHQHCERVAEATRSAFDVVEQARLKPSGRLRVSCPVGMAYRFLAPHLPAFLLAHPDVRLELELTNRQVELIPEGVDIALRARPTMDDPELVVRTFGQSPQVLVASPSFLSRRGAVDSIDALRGSIGIGPAGPNGERPSWRLTDAQGRVVHIDYPCALLTDDLQLLLQSALAGVGIAQLPLNLCAALMEEGRLQALLPTHALPPHQVHAVFPTRRGMMPAVRAFLDMLAAEVPAILERKRGPRASA
nr:LysR family transcriptional regulator [uncultured Roseateles sp.]